VTTRVEPGGLLVGIAELLEEHPHLADVSVAGFLLQAVTG